MIIKIVLFCCIAMNLITGCKAPDIVTPKNRILRTIASLRQGQTIEWDESVTDTVTPPSSIADSSSDFRNQCINRQVKSYHVVVSVPDSTIPHFQIARTVTSYAQRDTMGGQRISKVVTYGNQFTTYDQSNSVIATATMTVSGDSIENFADMPFFEYQPDTVVTDSARTNFVTVMTAGGGTVTNFGSSGYSVAMSFTENSNTWTTTSYYNYDYLALTRITASGAGTDTDESYSYTSVGGYRINSLQTTTSTTTAPSYFSGLYATNASSMNSDFYTTSTVTTISISNISLP